MTSPRLPHSSAEWNKNKLPGDALQPRRGDGGMWGTGFEKWLVGELVGWMAGWLAGLWLVRVQMVQTNNNQQYPTIIGNIPRSNHKTVRSIYSEAS